MSWRCKPYFPRFHLRADLEAVAWNFIAAPVANTAPAGTFCYTSHMQTILQSTRVAAACMATTIVGGAALLGCPSDSSYSAGGSGDLKRGTIAMLCHSHDATCPPDTTHVAPQTPVAVGAIASFSYSGQVPKTVDGRTSTISLASISTEMLAPLAETNPPSFSARMPGFVAVVAHTEQTTVTDFIHVHIVSVDHISLHPVSETNATNDPINTQLEPQQQITVRAIPRDDTDAPLAGVLTYTWQTLSNEIEIVHHDGPYATIKAVAPGSGTVRVSINGDSESPPNPVNAEVIFTVRDP